MDFPPSKVIEFDPPLVWQSHTVSEIELREPKAGEVIQAQSNSRNTDAAESALKFGIALIGAISGHPRQVIEQMPISKLQECIEFVVGFISGPGHQIGET